MRFDAKEDINALYIRDSDNKIVVRLFERSLDATVKYKLDFISSFSNYYCFEDGYRSVFNKEYLIVCCD